MFSYSGTYLTFTVPFTGTYIIECWGASGGTHNSYNYDGKGGYVKGSIELQQGNILYVYVGGKGTENGIGGWNGGASKKGISDSGTAYSDDSSGGGGSTDVRLAIGNLYSRIIVAGAGGGLNYYQNWASGSKGGDAGGLIGPKFPSRTQPAVCYNYGGTQTEGGKSQKSSSGCTGNNGSFGLGGSGHWGNGGGGWYGGSGGSNTPYPYNQSSGTSGGEIAGGGGSSFISGHPGCVSHSSYRGSNSNIVKFNDVEYVFTSTKMIDGEGKEWTTAGQTTGGNSATMPNPDGGTIAPGRCGHGYCRISGITLL